MNSSRCQSSGFRDVDLSVQMTNFESEGRLYISQHPCLSQQSLQFWAEGRNENVIW